MYKYKVSPPLALSPTPHPQSAPGFRKASLHSSRCLSRARARNERKSA